jgi:hypothetical protein
VRLTFRGRPPWRSGWGRHALGGVIGSVSEVLMLWAAVRAIFRRRVGAATRPMCGVWPCSQYEDREDTSRQNLASQLTESLWQ